MAARVSRWLFRALTGAALAAPRSLWAEETVPADLDHILLGVDDLDRGIAWVEQRTGVRAVFGGVHPGRGTRNALLVLGPRRYLEIIAPDPQQPLQGLSLELKAMHEPRLFNWAVHTGDLGAAAKKAVDASLAIDGPRDGSRTRPDGKTLRWKSFSLQDDRGGLLPFFIEWSPDSLHPSADAPPGCALKRFLLESPAAQELSRQLHELGVDVSVGKGEKPLLRAVITSPKGEVELGPK